MIEMATRAGTAAREMKKLNQPIEASCEQAGPHGCWAGTGKSGAEVGQADAGQALTKNSGTSTDTS